MDIGHALFKGIVQGLTEFLPVSSTAHLIFTDTLARILGYQSTPPLPGEEEFYDILLHLGTLAAVLVFFRQDLLQMWHSILNRLSPQYGDVKGPKYSGRTSLLTSEIPIYLVCSIMMTAILILSLLKGTGVIFSTFGWATPLIENLSDYYLAYPQWVAIHLIITGGLLWYTEKLAQKRRPEHFRLKHALIMGSAQAVAAIFHGISRSGSTISSGLASGIDRVTATRYSFMLSIPTFMMAAAYEFLKLIKLGHLGQLDWPAMLMGTVLSGIVGYFCVKYFILFVERHGLQVFSYYCWFVGITMFLFLSFA